MIIFLKMRFATAILFACLGVANAQADAYDDAIQVFASAGGSGKFFATAYGYALFPKVGKVGLGVGGARGKGRVFEQGMHVGNTTMTKLTAGLQAGGSVFSQIIFFQDKRALVEFTAGNFEFGAQAEAVAITAGASAATSTSGSSAGLSGGQNDATTTGQYYKGMAVFTVAKGGLMYEATIGGQKFNYKPVTTQTD